MGEGKQGGKKARGAAAAQKELVANIEMKKQEVERVESALRRQREQQRKAELERTKQVRIHWQRTQSSKVLFRSKSGGG